MTQTAFSSFDPLATHPFTNNSGLLPKPAAPSAFPHPIPPPSTLRAAQTDPSVIPGHLRTLHAPKPKPASSSSKSSSRSNGGASRPIFVPFRPERSSPELDDILLKKRVSDVFANKASWSIDQTTVPLPPAPLAANGKAAKAR